MATMSPLDGKTAIVIGGSSGIGRATALRLAGEGVHVLLAGRSADRLEAVRTEIECLDGKATAYPLDVRDHGAIEGLVDEAVRTTGRLNIMINGAGVEYLGSIADGDPADWRAMFEINVIALLVGAKAAIRAMRAGGFEGHIVHFGSVAGRSEDTGVYGATKAAVHALTSTLRAELENDPIRVVNIIPGAVMTNFVRTFPDDLMNGFLTSLGMAPTFRQGSLLSEAELAEIQRRASAVVASADDVANAVLFAVTQPVSVNIYEVFVRPPKNFS